MFEPYGTKGAHFKAMEIYILCSYRTNEYEDFKELARQIELFEDISEQNL